MDDATIGDLKAENERLKACPVPWCGSASPPEQYGGDNYSPAHIRCRKCRATVKAERMAEAVKIWNNRPQSQVSSLQQENERLREALFAIDQWASAYPVDIFPEPDLPAVTRLLEGAGMLNQMDRMHSSWARHIVNGIGGIASAALHDTGGSHG